MIEVTETNPAEAGFVLKSMDYCLRRRDAARPARPRPSSARVPGSGTACACTSTTLSKPIAGLIGARTLKILTPILSEIAVASKLSVSQSRAIQATLA